MLPPASALISTVPPLMVLKPLTLMSRSPVAPLATGSKCLPKATRGFNPELIPDDPAALPMVPPPPPWLPPIMDEGAIFIAADLAAWYGF